MVTVILATYQGERYLSDQLTSLINQITPVDRLVLHDDGSTDQTVSLVESWAGHHGIDLSNVTTGRRLGPAKAFLHALKNSGNADVYLFCDQDDVWLREKTTRAVEAVQNEGTTRPLLYATRSTIVDSKLRPIGRSATPRHLGFGSAICESVLSGCTMAMNRALRDIIVHELPEQCEMHDWWCYLVASGLGAIIYDSRPSVLYRQHSDNVVGSKRDSFSILKARLHRLTSAASSVRLAQLEELHRLHGHQLDEAPRRLLTNVIRSSHRSSLGARMKVLPLVKRQAWLDTLSTRLAVLAGRF